MSSLSQSSEYSTVTATCSQIAFLNQVPGLNDYQLADGKGWAQKLYNFSSNVSIVSTDSKDILTNSQEDCFSKWNC